MWLRCPWQSQIDREDNYAGKVQLAAGHTTRKHTLVHVALCRVPKDWNFSVLGVFETKGAAWDNGEGRSGAPALIGRVQGETKLAVN